MKVVKTSIRGLLASTTRGHQMTLTANTASFIKAYQSKTTAERYILESEAPVCIFQGQLLAGWSGRVWQLGSQMAYTQTAPSIPSCQEDTPSWVSQRFSPSNVIFTVFPKSCFQSLALSCIFCQTHTINIEMMAVFQTGAKTFPISFSSTLILGFSRH